MKHFILMAGLCLLAASCSKESVNEVVNGQTEMAVVPVKVHVDDFAISLEDEPRGDTRAVQDVADYSDITGITLAFYKDDGSEAYKHEQQRPDAGFGEFSLSLPMGSYTMVVVAYKTTDGNPFELTSPTAAAYTGEHAYETFATTQVVNITSTNALDLSATLNRVVSRLVVVSSDGRTANVVNVRMTLSAGGKSFNPTTGAATVNTGLVNTVGIKAETGEPSQSSTYLFLLTDEQKMDVTIEALDADGNALFSKTVNDVPFKRNRMTKLIGNIYTNNALSGGFRIETAWLDNHVETF